MAIARSPMAHARITGTDISAVLRQPGVVAAFTGADLAGDYGSLPTAWHVSDDLIVPDHRPVVIDEARYLGDAVAVVVAEEPYQAADALEAVGVDYEDLPAVIDMVAALAPERRSCTPIRGPTELSWGFTAGDYEATKAGADVVVSRRFVQQRVIPAAMEPRAVLAEPAPATGEFTLWTSTQVPHFVRILMSTMCGIPEHKLRVIAPDVGGAFGGKLNVYAEEAIALAVARRLGRPVKWTASRREDFQATTHGRDMIQDVEITATRDGRVRGLKVDLTADMGAYLQLLTPAVPLLGRYVYPGIYKFDAHEFFCQGVFTTKTPTDSYRGAGRPEAAFAIERIMDELAAELGIDPLELRELNWIGTRSSRIPRSPGLPTTAAITKRPPPAPESFSATTPCVASRPSGGSAATWSSSGSACRYTPRWPAWGPPAGSVSMATPPGAGRRRPYACFPPAGWRPSSAPRRTARGTSPRSARSSPTPWAFPSTTSTSCTATPRSPPGDWTLTGHGR